MRNDLLYLIEHDAEVYDAQKRVWNKVRRYFQKDKMSKNTAVVYFTYEAVERALANIYQLENVRIIAVAPVGEYTRREDGTWLPVQP